MKNARIGWIGLGRHTELVMYQCLKGLPADVVAVCDVDPQKLASFTKRYNVPACYTDFREMAQKEDFDAVICIVEAQEHYEVAKLFMEQGINVFVEKAPCVNLRQAQELAEIQSKTGKYTMTGFNRRFAAPYTMARDISSKGEFGRITMYMAKYNAGKYRSEEYYISNHIINHLDLARYLIGEIKSLHTDKIKINNQQVGFNISFVAQSGAIGVIQSGSLQHIAYPMERVEITGIGRNIIVDNFKRLEYNRPPSDANDFEHMYITNESDALVWNHNMGLANENSFLGYEVEMRHFIKCVIDSSAPSPNFFDTLHTMELMDSFINSVGR